jgi:hypothetical protein
MHRLEQGAGMIPVVVIPVVRPSQWTIPRWGSSIEAVLRVEGEAIHARYTAAADMAAKLQADGWNLTLSADGHSIVCVHPDIRTEEQATDRLVLLGFDFDQGCFYVGLEQLQEAILPPEGARLPRQIRGTTKTLQEAYRENPG